MSNERCHGCGGYLQPGRRLTLARKITGDLVFDGYQCYLKWDARERAKKAAAND